MTLSERLRVSNGPARSPDLSPKAMKKMAEEMPNYLAAETLSENMTKPTSEQKIFGFQNPKTKSAIER